MAKPVKRLPKVFEIELGEDLKDASDEHIAALKKIVEVLSARTRRQLRGGIISFTSDNNKKDVTH
jgi:hypothetical protein